MRKNAAGQSIGAQVVNATNGSAFTGSVVVYVTGDAGSQAVGSVGAGACAYKGNGYHTYSPAQAETNYDLVAFTFIGTGAVPVTVQVSTWESLSRVVNVGMLDGEDAPTYLRAIVDDQLASYGVATEANVDTEADGIADLIGTPNVTLANDLAAVAADANSASTQAATILTRMPTALVGGKMDCNVGSVSGDTTAADNAEKFFDGSGYGVHLARGTLTDAPNNTEFETDFSPGSNSSAFIGCTILLHQGSARYLGRVDGLNGAGIYTVSWSNGTPNLAVGNVVEIFLPDEADRIQSLVSSVATITTKLPSKSYLTGTSNSDGDIEINEATGNYPGTIGALAAQAKADVNEQVDAAIADVGLTTTRTGYLDKLNIQGNVASADDVGGGHITPVNQVPVPLARTWILKPGDDGWEGELPLVRRVGENQPFAVDFRNDLPNNGRLVSLDATTVISGPAGGIVISGAAEDRGVDRSQAKFKINLLDVGTYVIAVQVTYEGSDGGGTSEGSVTLIVRPSLNP